MKHIFYLPVLLFIFACSASNPQNDQKEQYVDSFEKAYKSGQWELALKYLDTLRLQKIDLNLLPVEAECYAGLGQYDKAISLLENEIKVHTDTTQGIHYIYHTLGNVYYHKGDYKNALYKYKTAVQLRPSYARPYIYIADIYQKLNEKDSCVFYYMTAIRLFAANKYFDEVIDFSNRIISVDSLNIDGYEFLYYGYHSKGMYKEAVTVGLKLDELLDPSKNLDKKHTNYLFTGVSAHWLGDYQLAYELINLSIQSQVVLDDYGWMAFCYLSAIQTKLGNNELAKKYADYALLIDSVKTQEYIKDLLK